MTKKQLRTIVMGYLSRVRKKNMYPDEACERIIQEAEKYRRSSNGTSDNEKEE